MSGDSPLKQSYPLTFLASAFLSLTLLHAHDWAVVQVWREPFLSSFSVHGVRRNWRLFMFLRVDRQCGQTGQTGQTRPGQGIRTTRSTRVVLLWIRVNEHRMDGWGQGWMDGVETLRFAARFYFASIYIISSCALQVLSCLPAQKPYLLIPVHLHTSNTYSSLPISILCLLTDSLVLSSLRLFA